MNENITSASRDNRNLVDFIRQMGGNMRTSHLVKIFTDGLNNRDQPVGRREVRENYNKDLGRQSTMLMNTKFRENPMQSYYPPKIVRTLTGTRSVRQYNPKLIDYIINPARENYQVAGLQNQRNGLKLAMLRHTNRLGRFDNRVLRQGNYRPAISRGRQIRRIENIYFNRQCEPDKLRMAAVKRPFHSLEEFLVTIKRELMLASFNERVTSTQDSNEIDPVVFKRCMVRALKRSAGLGWVSTYLNSEITRYTQPRPIVDNINQLEDVGGIASPPRAQPGALHSPPAGGIASPHSPPATLSSKRSKPLDKFRQELKYLREHVDYNHLKLVETLLTEIRDLMGGTLSPRGGHAVGGIASPHSPPAVQEPSPTSPGDVAPNPTNQGQKPPDNESIGSFERIASSQCLL